MAGVVISARYEEDARMGGASQQHRQQTARSHGLGNGPTHPEKASCWREGALQILTTTTSSPIRGLHPTI